MYERIYAFTHFGPHIQSETSSRRGGRTQLSVVFGTRTIVHSSNPIQALPRSARLFRLYDLLFRFDLTSLDVSTAAYLAISPHPLPCGTVFPVAT